MLITENKSAVLQIQKQPRFCCPTHGEHKAVMAIAFFKEPIANPPTLEKQYLFCMKCYVAKLEELQISQMIELPDETTPKN